MKTAPNVLRPGPHVPGASCQQVNWAFEASPAHDGGEDDEGWGSDTLAPRPRPRPSRELRELVSRVASLEAKLKSSRLEAKGQGEEGKGATWPG